MSLATALTALATQRDNLAANLTTMGVTAANTETLAQLVPKVLNIESGGGGGDVLFTKITPLNPTLTIVFPSNNIPDVIVIVGPVSGSSANVVGLAIHIRDANGGIYQEKWRYQSTKYLIGTSATDGSLFTVSEHSSTSISISINSGETSFGTTFSRVEYKIFAAKLY